MTPLKPNNFLNTLFLGCIFLAISACNSEFPEKTTEEEGDKMLQDMQKTEKEKADSVLEYWKNKTGDSI